MNPLYSAISLIYVVYQTYKYSRSGSTIKSIYNKIACVRTSSFTEALRMFGSSESSILIKKVYESMINNAGSDLLTYYIHYPSKWYLAFFIPSFYFDCFSENKKVQNPDLITIGASSALLFAGTKIQNYYLNYEFNLAQSVMYGLILQRTAVEVGEIINPEEPEAIEIGVVTLGIGIILQEVQIMREGIAISRAGVMAMVLGVGAISVKKIAELLVEKEGVILAILSIMMAAITAKSEIAGEGATEIDLQSAEGRAGLLGIGAVAVGILSGMLGVWGIKGNSLMNVIEEFMITEKNFTSKELHDVSKDVDYFVIKDDLLEFYEAKNDVLDYFTS